MSNAKKEILVILYDLPVAKPAQTLNGMVKAYRITFAAVVDVGLEAASRHVQFYLNSLSISYRYRYSIIILLTYIVKKHEPSTGNRSLDGRIKNDETFPAK